MIDGCIRRFDDPTAGFGQFNQSLTLVLPASTDDEFFLDELL